MLHPGDIDLPYDVFPRLFRFSLIWASVAVGCTSSLTARLPQPAGSPPLQAVRLRDVTLHYVAVGRGEPVVMVHGGLEDYRAWSAQLAPLLWCEISFAVAGCLLGERLLDTNGRKLWR